MRKIFALILNSRNGLCLAAAAAALSLLTAAPAFSGARPQTAITVQNNSNLEIRHLYLSAVENDNWGPDQLNSAVISPGGQFSFSASCQQSQVRVILEDKDGCFLSRTVDCGDSATVTINSNDTPNCGG